MAGTLQTLLHYYERELVMSERLGNEFHQRYPQLASDLGLGGVEASKDPHLRRLLQGCALLNARTAMRIDQSDVALTEALLHVTYPHYLRPFPSATIVQFDTSGRAGTMLQDSATIPRATVLHAPELDGVRCRFRTLYPVTLAPVRLAQVRYSPVFQPPASTPLAASTSSCISITLESTSDRQGLAELALPAMRLYINAERSLASKLRDTLFTRIGQAWLDTGPGQQWRPLSDIPLRPVGFSQDEAALPFEARSHPAFRLLTEYFCFPEKFNFMDIDLASLAVMLPANCRTMTLHFGIAERQDDSNAALLMSLSAQHLLTACTPAVNLFGKAACAISMDHTKSEYALLADASHPRCYDIFSIDAVSVMDGRAAGSQVFTFRPYYSLQHGSAAGATDRYWFSRRDDVMAETSPGHETSLALVDRNFDPHTAATSASVSVDLTCTNRGLPSRLQPGAEAGDFVMTSSLAGVPIRMLRKPTPQLRFSSKDHWRLISHLSLNHYSLTQEGATALVELLSLYDLPQSPATQHQIAGIVGLSQQTVRRRWRDKGAAGYVHGIEITLRIDVQAYAGSGLHIFVQLLDHFFGFYVHLNSFVQLVVHCHRTGKELMRCQPRSGNLNVL